MIVSDRENYLWLFSEFLSATGGELILCSQQTV